jgi:hypothetical protein
MQAKFNGPLRTGLLLVTLAWFSFNLYQFTLFIFTRHPTLPFVVEDISATLGSGFNAAASFLAVITVLFYVVKRDLTDPEARMAVRFIVILEAVNFIFYLPAALATPLIDVNRQTIASALESTLPLAFLAIVIPIALAKLFFELNPKRPAKGAIKWGLISGTSYLFALWLLYAGNWAGAIIVKGIDYVSLYPVNLFSFVLTLVGLLALTIFAGYFSKKFLNQEGLAKLDLKSIGIIITALGLYFNLTYALWLLFGNVGGWSTWYAWFLNHAYLYLWILSAPLVGLPLLFSASNKDKKSNSGGTLPLISWKRKHLNLFIFTAQIVGAIFYGVFSAAYILSLPSTQVLSGEPVFRLLLSVFEGLFIICILIGLILSVIAKIED